MLNIDHSLSADDSNNELDANTIKRLEASLSPKAKELYEFLKGKTGFTLHDRNKDTRELIARCYTDTGAKPPTIWLEPTLPDLEVVFVHELGQVYVYYLGYNIQEKKSDDQEKAKRYFRLANCAINAFIGWIAERELQRYGIERSAYRKRAIEFDFINGIPLTNDPKLKNPEERARICFHYVLKRLYLGKNYQKFEAQWLAKVKDEEIRHAARKIYLEAARQEITPERYTYLSRFFARTLRLGDIFE